MITKISTIININTMAKQVPAIKWKVLMKGIDAKTRQIYTLIFILKFYFYQTKPNMKKGP
jgi:hypothetical protein